MRERPLQQHQRIKASAQQRQTSSFSHLRHEHLLLRLQPLQLLLVAVYGLTQRRHVARSAVLERSLRGAQKSRQGAAALSKALTGLQAQRQAEGSSGL